MIKTILPATLLSSLLISTAFALPLSPTSHEKTATSPTTLDIITNTIITEPKEILQSRKEVHNKYYDNKYYYGGRYYGHRYYARPPGWQTLGCFAAGPVWYCP